MVGARMCVLLLSGTLLWTSPIGAYTEEPVSNGGTITGTVTLNGGKPRAMAFNLVTIPDAVYCGRISTGTGWRIVEDFLISRTGELKDAVVMVRGITKGKAFTLKKVEIEALDCDFLPFVNVLKDRAEVTVINMDPVEHDIQGYETARSRGARVLFNRPLPMNKFHQVIEFFKTETHTHLPGTPMVEPIHLRKGRNLFVMQCGFHPYMFSWGVVVKNPYFFITKEDGKFEIKDVPPGDYTLSVWHPGMKTFLDKPISVKPQGMVVANFEYQSPKGRRSVHEMVDNPKFGLEVLGEGVEIVPSLRLQNP